MERFVSPDIARQLAHSTFTAPDQARVERRMEIAFIALIASDAASYSECAGVVSDIAMQNEGVVHSLLPIIVIGFGCVCAASPDSCRRFVASVQSQLPDAAIVHGTFTASVGSFGSNSRCVFGFWWPGLLDAFRQLATLSPGQVQELRPNDRNTSVNANPTAA